MLRLQTLCATPQERKIYNALPSMQIHLLSISQDIYSIFTAFFFFYFADLRRDNGCELQQATVMIFWFTFLVMLAY